MDVFQGVNQTLADVTNRYERAQNSTQSEGIRRAIKLQQRKVSANIKVSKVKNSFFNQLWTFFS